MPVEVTYPGVTIEESPQDRRDVTPVATSIAAFVGRTPMGPTDQPQTIFSFGDFQEQFGGLQSDYPVSYAVQDFFLNGGSQAIIARLFEPANGDGFARLTFPPSSSDSVEAHTAVVLQAANPGDWGNRLVATVDTNGITDTSAKRFESNGITKDDLFNLTIEQRDSMGRTLRTERYLNLSVKSGGKAGQFANRLDRVLSAQSNLARVAMMPVTRPANGAVAQGTGGNDGTYLNPLTYFGNQDTRTGIYLLENADLFNLLCIPPDRRCLAEVPESLQDLDPTVRNQAAHYATDRRAFFIVDPPAEWKNLAQQEYLSAIDPEQLGIGGMNRDGIEVARNCAVYFPRIIKEDPLMDGKPAVFAPCGAIAGIIAATDANKGVWQAPAGQQAGLSGVSSLEVDLTDEEGGLLNPKGINCLRSFPIIGPVVWGARTLRGADQLEDEYKYIAVRRLMLFVEESLDRSTKWTAFEPNNEALWSWLRLSVGSFLAGLVRLGAFYSYYVICDATTNTAQDIAAGSVNILIGVAPENPAEFVILQITQPALMATPPDLKPPESDGLKVVEDHRIPQEAYHHDPYRSYKFRLKWDGRYVAGVSKVSALTRTTQVIAHPADDDSTPQQRVPGQNQFAPITIERGVTRDDAFERWANMVPDYSNSVIDDQSDSTGNQDVPSQDFRKDIILELYNEAGQKVLAYNIYRCWPSEYIATPELDANGNAVAITMLKLENEGWERDTSVNEPTEPSYALPARTPTEQTGDYRSIAVVTAALSDIVSCAVQDVLEGTDVKVEIGPPKAVTAGETVVNIYVYRVSPNPRLRNSDLPRYATDERPGTLPTAAVDLHYVITFASDTPLATDLLMGRVVAMLHAFPGIGRARLTQMLGKGGAYHALAGSGMAEAHDLVTFTPEYLSLDELSKLWTVLFQLSHRPSLQFIASPVFLSLGPLASSDQEDVNSKP